MNISHNLYFDQHIYHEVTWFRIHKYPEVSKLSAIIDGTQLLRVYNLHHLTSMTWRG